MKTLALWVVCLSLLFCIHVRAQTDFEKIEKASLLARSGLSEKGSPSELLNASRILKSVKWSVLNLQNVDRKAEISVNGRLVFVPEFMDSLYVNRLVYKTASDYLLRAEKENRRSVSNMVRLTTKAVSPGGTVVYGIRLSGNLSVDVSAVTDPYGAINMKVKVLEKLNGPGNVYSDHYRETEGYSHRKLRGIKSEGNKIMLIEITNRTDYPVNYALIMNTQKL